MSNFFKLTLFFFLDYIVIAQKQLLSSIPQNPPKQWRLGSKGDVVLVPGFNERWVFFKKTGDTVNAAGFRVHVIDELGRNLLPIKRGSAIVEKYIRENKLQKVIFLSHSKGGIIAKYLLDSLVNEGLVRSSFSIATPYGGTVLGYLRAFSLDELLPGSSALRELNKQTKNNHLVTNIFTRYDNHILPSANTVLKGAKNIEVNVIGHTRILDAEDTVATIKKSLL